jgi:[ribosomal protein S5]-alanine N-acetyltransferase
MHYADGPISNHPLVSYRPLARSDAEAWYAYLRLPEVFEHTSWNLRSVDDLAPLFDLYDSKDPESPVRFAILSKDSRALIGTFGFHTVSSINRTAELAFDLSPSIWGKGIAKAMCQSATTWAFTSCGLVRVQATVLETNQRSIHTLEKSGFQREGYLRSFRQVRGRSGNFWMYSRVTTECGPKEAK